MHSSPISRWQTALTWIFGFLLPTGTLLFESLSHFCADALFDPLPSFLHQGVVAWVPLGFLFALNVHSSNHPLHRHLPWVLGSMLSICIIYSLPFIPWLGIALLALLYFGLGFLPLTPLLAALVCLRWIAWLRKQGHVEHLTRRIVLGMLLGGLLFAIADGRRWITHHAAEMAASAHPATNQRGFWLLRQFGDEDILLKLSQRIGAESMLYSTEVSPETARQLYFRLTGQALASSGFDTDSMDRFREILEPGDTTWSSVPGLTLTTSHLKTALDPSVPLAYLQWEMVLSHEGPRAAEALAEIALPAGAHVSRVTLWIGGEPREAAFGGRSQVTEAYEDVVVVQNKDPLLVTTAGPDRVRMRAFPVPAGGSMRLLLGITAPLDVVQSSEGRLNLPYFSEQNFALGEESHHQIQLENAGRALRLHAPRGLANPFQMTDDQLASFETFVAIHRDDSHSAFWRGDDPQNPELVARLIQGQKPRPRHLVVVIDGSARMANHRQDLELVLPRLTTAWPGLDLVFASDEVEVRRGAQTTQGTGAGQWLAERRFVGGQDNVPALLRGIALAQAETGGAVLWLGGKQPLELPSVEALQTALDAQQPLPAIFMLPLEPGAQRLWDHFETRGLYILPRYGNLVDDIAAFPGVDPQRLFFQLRFDPPGTPRPAGALQASSHLTRLWAANEVQRLQRRKDDKAQQDALRLAVQHQLVTSLSGAVVLETAEQYADHELQPVSPGSVPTIPEPEVWALLLVALLTAAWAYRRQTTA